MSGWKKLDVKDLDLDIEGEVKGQIKPSTIAKVGEYHDFDALSPLALHKAGKNTLRIWAAYRTHRERYSKNSEVKLPAWVLEYFDEVADKLLNVNPDCDIRKLCQSALNITKKEVTRFNKTKREIEIAERVRELCSEAVKKNRAKVKTSSIIKRVAAEYSCSETKVRKCTIEHGKFSEEHDPLVDAIFSKGQIPSDGTKAKKKKRKRPKN